MRVVVLLATVVAAVAALLAKMAKPSQLAFIRGNAPDSAAPRSGCTFWINEDLGLPQPVYLVGENFLRPNGNSGHIHINAGQQVNISCPGRGLTIQHPNILSSVQQETATCVNDNLVSGFGWLSGNSAFGELNCSAPPLYNAAKTGATCFNNAIVIRVGFIVDNVFRTWYHSCFDQNRLEVLYVWYNQDATNAVHQTGVGNPKWLPGSFFPRVNIDDLYTQKSQKQVIAGIVGQDMIKDYFTSHQFLSRGHLTAKSDFVFATGQRASFYFINAAPQWQSFNGGNWNDLEQNLRTRIGKEGFNTVIYTGTFGVSQLRDARGNLHDIYLLHNGNTRQLPVPLYYYKVVHDAGLRLGTAFVGINNPYYTKKEARDKQFCIDRCRNNDAFKWLKWKEDDVALGYSFCCTIADFRKKVPYLPNFSVDGLLA